MSRFGHTHPMNNDYCHRGRFPGGSPFDRPGFPGGFGRGGFDEFAMQGGFGRRPRARRGDVRRAILLILNEEALNGYGIIQKMNENSDGAWTPSSGAIYPALNQLEDEGLIEPDPEAGNKFFTLTDTGKQEAKNLADGPAPWENQGGEEAHQAAHDLRNSFQQAAMAMRSVFATSNEEYIKQAQDLVDDLRKQLYKIMSED